MTPYLAYKPTNIDWICNIPEHWDIKRLKFNTYIKARIGWHGLKSDEFSMDGEVYCVTGTDFINGKINWGSCYKISNERYDENPFIQLKKGDLLITKDGTIGKLALVDTLRGKATLNSGIFVVRPLKGEYLTEYLYWALQSPLLFDYVAYTSKGSTIIHLYQDNFYNLPLIIPPLEEQTAIANYLDKKTADIDGLIAKKQQLITFLREERTAVINHAVTKGINPDAPLKPSGIEWLGDIPQHWEVKKLKYVATKVQTGSTPPSSEEKYYNDEVNWFTPSDFSDNISLENSKRKISISAIDEGVIKLFPSNSVLMVGIGATLGKVGYISQPAASNQQINSISFDNEITAKFYAYFFYSNQLNIVALANAATLAILNQSQTKDIPLPFPFSEEEIAAIVEHIETQTQKIDTAIEKIEKEITLLQEYRTALISEVVTGKIKVT